MLFHRLARVLRAGGREAALIADERGEQELVAADQTDEQMLSEVHNLYSSVERARRSGLARSYGKEAQHSRTARQPCNRVRRAEREADPPIQAADRPSGIRPTQVVRAVEGCAASIHGAFQRMRRVQLRNPGVRR